MSESISVSVSEKANVSDAAGNSSGRIYWVGGSKGGVGKSMMTLATVDHLLKRGANVLLVECDTSNPDVWKAYKEEVETELIDLDEADGWIHLVNTCDRRSDSVVVINTAARNNLAVKQYGSTLDSSLEELGSQLIALWVINRQRDSLELLREFIDAVAKAGVQVVRNGYFGEERKFELYNGSKIREEVESRGGKSITLPDLADRVADDIYVRRISLNVSALPQYYSDVANTPAVAPEFNGRTCASGCPGAAFAPCCVGGKCQTSTTGQCPAVAADAAADTGDDAAETGADAADASTDAGADRRP